MAVMFSLHIFFYTSRKLGDLKNAAPIGLLRVLLGNYLRKIDTVQLGKHLIHVLLHDVSAFTHIIPPNILIGQEARVSVKAPGLLT